MPVTGPSTHVPSLSLVGKEPMDQGHYNCRDYYFPLPIATTHAGEPRTPLNRHESWAELEQRSRSPASLKPKFPLLRLPLELRQQILHYLLPRTTQEFDTPSMQSPNRESTPIACFPSTAGISSVIWQRGNVKVFRVCKQLHEECADLMYGGNTFLLLVTFKGITFRYSWRLTSGLAPTTSIDFIDRLPPRYAARVRKLTVCVDHLDSYTAMANYNVSAKGLMHGTRRQVQRLVNHLSPNIGALDERRTHHGLAVLRVSVRKGRVNGEFWRGRCKASSQPTHQDDELDVREILQPLAQLRGIRAVTFDGAVPSDFAQSLADVMRGNTASDNDVFPIVDADDGGMQAVPRGIRLCVYGNDL